MTKISILLFLFSVPCSMHAATPQFNPPGSDYGVYLEEVVGGDRFACEFSDPEWQAAEKWKMVKAIGEENNSYVIALSKRSALSDLEKSAYLKFVGTLSVVETWYTNKKTLPTSPIPVSGGYRDYHKAWIERIAPHFIDKSNEWNRSLRARVSQIEKG